MSESIKVTGASIEQATRKGLAKLGLTEDAVEVVVIAEPKKGLFGFGKKDAIVELTPKAVEEVTTTEEVIESACACHCQQKAQEVTEGEVIEEVVDTEEVEESSGYEQAIYETKQYLENLSEIYGAQSTVTVEQAKDSLVFRFETDKPGLLIGKHGKILNALQTLAQAMVHRYVRGRVSVTVDVGDYRERRSKTLKSIAERTAERVLRTKQPVFLEPLPAYERKQIHAYLSNNKHISTHSEGKEPHRYLVVEVAE
ncbi:spoIIIJ-associated protein [Granulicatella balaenopterae]|uniref:RNA-binding protein KhpB n=1 Tax=Granulicatella balaenopterae TaxID=137733 RepID=A0A1H9NCT4_9LACT|nr:RNA-binding cell elongation regulator Jag/EloR [Granulicatella balaenopterae]SER33183.1 spoIIIJ-associated protein [Granulicatella balaenopterae]